MLTQKQHHCEKLSTHLSKIPHELKTGPGIFHIDDKQACYVIIGSDKKLHSRPIDPDDSFEQQLLQQWEAFKAKTQIKAHSMIYSHRNERRVLRLSFQFLKENINFVAMEEPEQPLGAIAWLPISSYNLNHGCRSQTATRSIDIFEHIMETGIPVSPQHVLSHDQLSEIQLAVHPESLIIGILGACSPGNTNTNMIILKETGSAILPTHWYKRWQQPSRTPDISEITNHNSVLVRQLIEHPEAAIYEGRAASDWTSIVPNISSIHINHAVELDQVTSLSPTHMPIRKAYRDEVLARNPSIPDVIEVSFYGSGDQGSAEDIWPYIKDKDFEIKEEPCLITNFFKDYSIEVRAQGNEGITFDESLREIAYQILEQYHDGWENDSGAQGTVGIYLKAEQPYAEVLQFEYLEEEEEEYS